MYLQWFIPVGFVFQGSSVCQVTAIGVTVILLYTSRACYNLFILSFSQIKNVHSFDYDWYNVSDQVSRTRQGAAQGPDQWNVESCFNTGDQVGEDQIHRGWARCCLHWD